MAGMKGTSITFKGFKPAMERLAAAGGPLMITRMRTLMKEAAAVGEVEIEQEYQRHSSGRSHWFTWRKHNIRFLIQAGWAVEATRSGESKNSGKVGAWAATTIKLAPHIYMLEFGTSRARAHPRFRTAVDRAKPKMKGLIVDGLSVLMDETFGAAHGSEWFDPGMKF